MKNAEVIPNESLVLALTAFLEPRTPSRIASVLKTEGRRGLCARFLALSSDQRNEVLRKADEMATKGIDALLIGDRRYPKQLGSLSNSSPILFFWGAVDLLGHRGIGMCGSRHATDLGLKAAVACGEEANSRNLVIVSGYARGVDTETHLAALRGGGKTIIVLAEGFDHFRIKRSFPRHLFRSENVLVISQFAPKQPWTAGAAMTRNRLIYGLGIALVVVEAGEKGGTRAAGEGALSAGRPVFVLDFDQSTPAGNRVLLDRGGIPISNRKKLGEEIRRLLSRGVQSHQQLSFVL